MTRGPVVLAALAAATAIATASAATERGFGGAPIEVVVTLRPAPLAEAAQAQPRLFALHRNERLDLRAAASTAYRHTLALEQDALVRRIVETVPGARVRWRYTIVLDGLAVVLAPSELGRLAAVPGVERVYPSVTYRARLDRTVPLIGAPKLWGPGRSTAGNGIKIGIIDDGVDQAHPFFDPTGFTAPPGFPKGDRAYTTAKVIVARAFPPPSPQYAGAALPFDPATSEHATHVAGIAAGDFDTTTSSGRHVSGVAPSAYLGNYKVLTIPTDLGLNGNSPEIAAGIEAAVADGMDVINLSLGEAEVPLSRDLVVRAIDAAAAAGVVPVVAAGNSFSDLGPGSIDSPGTAPRAITVAATTKSDALASFSSGGPTPLSLQLKPDVAAPGVDVYSSVPSGWASFSGTSMASPHVAGAAALLLNRHRWTPAQVKAALVETGRAVFSRGREVPPTREGGGLIYVPAADDPRVLAEPSSLSFGFLHPGRWRWTNVYLAAAGGGTGAWSARVVLAERPSGLTVRATRIARVPGYIVVRATASLRARQGEASGFILLSRGSARRRIPFWVRVTAPVLGREADATLTRAGIYASNTSGGPTGVSSYRYPADPRGLGITRDLLGPERVFRFSLRRPVANFGAVIVSEGAGASVEPRIARNGDENELAGYAALPFVLNPYLPTFGSPELVAAAVRPLPGPYDIVFDSPSSAGAGPFRFRVWINDVTPPAIALLTGSAAPSSMLRIRVSDRGSGVDPQSIEVSIDGTSRQIAYAAQTGIVSVRSPRASGEHRLVVRAWDYQETKNMENVPRILPNTTTYRTPFAVR